MCRLAVARAEQVPAVAAALATMHKGKETMVCSRFTASILTRYDLDAQLNLSSQGIGDGGAAAIARVLASNRTVTRVCGQHRVPAWGHPCGTHAHRWHLSLRMRARASRRCEQLSLDNNGIGAAGAAVLADALIANSTLRVLGLVGNSIGDEGAAALTRALATNSSLTGVCIHRRPQWVGSEWWGCPLLCTHTRIPPASFVGGGGGTAASQRQLH